jgi:transposase
VCTGFWCGILREIEHLGDPGIDGRIILKMDLKDVGYDGMDWIELAHVTDRWRALVNVVIWRPRAQIRGVWWTSSVSPPEEHHERRTFCRRGGNSITCDSGSVIDS